MIDTVILSVAKSRTQDYMLDGGGVSDWVRISRAAGHEKYVKNPTKAHLESGHYYPRLTWHRRKRDKIAWESNIYIEFSCAKLIYLNNVDELCDSQFSDVVRTLKKRIEEMGIGISVRDLTYAQVRVVHYSKNIPLTDGYTSQYVISELGKINLNKRFDLTKARYMNDGQSLCAYSQSHSVIIYDKIADLARGKKRAIDRDQTPLQLSLFHSFSMMPVPPEILRIEARLSQKVKMNALFKKIGISEHPTFKQVFSSARSKKVLTHYWETMLTGNMAVLFAHLPTIKDLLKQIQLSHIRIKPKEAIYRTGLIWLMRDGSGARELRSVLTKHANYQTWYRIAKAARETGDALGKFKPRAWYEQIRKALDIFLPYKINGP